MFIFIFLSKMLNYVVLFLIQIRQKIFSSHTWILRDFLYSEPVCAHYPHCSEYGKICFERYTFLPALKYTMTRISNCKPSNTIKYDPPFYKVVFFSSSPIWVPFLKKIIEDDRFDLVWVVTMPDAPSGRGQKLKENIIWKELKWELDWFQVVKNYEDGMNEIEDLEVDWKKVKLFKPKKIKNNKIFEEELKKLDPDYFVVISYGKILPQNILDIPKFGPINIHGSILPKYRGASPIQSVFLNKEKETGISLMYMNEKMDEGDVIKILKFPLTKQDNAKTVIDKFVAKWPNFVADVLWDFGKWNLKRNSQDHSQATYCGKFTKQDGQISFQNETAEDIYAKFQAFYLWPGIYTYWNWKLIKFTDIEYQNDKSHAELVSASTKENSKIDPEINLGLQLLDESLESGKVIFEDWVLKIWTKKWIIVVKKLKPEWKKELTASEFVNGYNDFVWTKLS